MNSQDRHSRIRELLDASPYLTYTSLAITLNVSSMTIRRDIRFLAKQGLVEPTTGGAMKANTVRTSERLDSFAQEKRQIGHILATLIKPGTSLFLDAGSTVYYCLESIAEIPHLSLILYDTRLISMAQRVNNARVFICGGELDAESGHMIGPAAEDFLKQFQPDVCLVSCSALSPHGRLGCHRSHEIALKRIIIQQAKQTFLVADHSKAGQHALLHFGTLKNIDVIITDKKPNSPISRLLKQNRVKYAG